MTVNGVSVRPPKVYSGNGLMLQRAGIFLLLLSRLGLAVLWDGGETRGCDSHVRMWHPVWGQHPAHPAPVPCRHAGVHPAAAAAPGPRGGALRELRS